MKMLKKKMREKKLEGSEETPGGSEETVGKTKLNSLL